MTANNSLSSSDYLRSLMVVVPNPSRKEQIYDVTIFSSPVSVRTPWVSVHFAERNLPSSGVNPHCWSENPLLALVQTQSAFGHPIYKLCPRKSSISVEKMKEVQK